SRRWGSKAERLVPERSVLQHLDEDRGRGAEAEAERLAALRLDLDRLGEAVPAGHDELGARGQPVALEKTEELRPLIDDPHEDEGHVDGTVEEGRQVLDL